MPITSAPVSPLFVAGAGVTETPDSGKFTLNQKWRVTQKLMGSYTAIADLAGVTYYRGVTAIAPVIGGLILNGKWIVAEVRIDKQKPGAGTMEIDWENTNTITAVDEWDVEPEDLQPHLERNPLYASLLPSDFATIQQAIQAATNGALKTALNNVASCSNPALATQLYQKMRGGMETYQLYGARYHWSTYFLPGAVSTVNQGGYQEFPGGPAGYILPAGFAWLRQADKPGQADNSPLGGIVKVTRSWIGAPNGFWDTDIYPTFGGTDSSV